MSQTVLVTGASSGIGAAVAHLFHLRGFTVFGTTRAANPVSQREFQMLSLDVNSDAGVQACVDQVYSRTGRLDILVNNAGYVLSGAAEETSVAEAKAQFETNLFGAIRMVNAVLPAMREAKAGKIFNIGSLAGLTAVPFSAFYCATKFALEAYSEALWYELKPFGIAVTLIEPGFVSTGIQQASRVAAEQLPHTKDHERAQLPPSPVRSSRAAHRTSWRKPSSALPRVESLVCVIAWEPMLAGCRASGARLHGLSSRRECAEGSRLTRLADSRNGNTDRNPVTQQGDAS